ncbi:MAG: hypothetical protein IJ604_00520 [Prevotella sp.]|nr:hypothetical protein [Prevotella sp.]MBR1461854.1 hypothetical protein [Prevotella sp.]
MSKTIELQIGKSQTLIDGLRKNLEELKARGISDADLNKMSEELDLLSKCNSECDALRAELSLKVKKMNAVLNDVKDSFAAKKRIIKVNYPQEAWANYGVMDKR